jgi:isopentenyl phosphate kinase
MIFLKLGGSLITEKQATEKAREDVIRQLAQEIAAVKQAQPEMQLLLGHGSGSFGHHVAAKYNTQLGAKSWEEWQGFSEVWSSANRLHRIVIDSLRAAGLPALSFPPSASAITQAGAITAFSFEPIQNCLSKGLLPVVHGDVAFDLDLGATIVSTEKVLAYLANHFHPHRLLLAGKEAGILDASGELIHHLSTEDRTGLSFYAPDGLDVTGGMAAKVDEALSLAQKFSKLEIMIFGAGQPGVLEQVLRGGSAGTRISA